MARIRSTHPGQWTDEDFVECSPLARLLCIALRNEADDKGVFMWKPKGLKMRLLPADTADVPELLLELVSNNQIKAFEVDGVKYGAIRNFRKWQRPKTPNSIYPITEDMLVYVWLKKANLGNDGETGSSEPDAISETMGKTGEQMEEEGGKVEEVKKDSCLVEGDTNGNKPIHGDKPSLDSPPFLAEASPRNQKDLLGNGGADQLPPGKFPPLNKLGKGKARKYPAEFLKFWSTWPKATNDSKASAYTAWRKGVHASGVDDLQKGAVAHAAATGDKVDFRVFVATWVSREAWEDASGDEGGGKIQTPYQRDLAKWLADEEHAKLNNLPIPPRPKRPKNPNNKGSGK